MKENRSFAAPLIAAGIFALCAQTPGHAEDRQLGSANGTTAKSTTRIGEQPEKMMSAIRKPPTTPLELLQNIKFAFDQNLPLREDFYTDANLMLFFGGRKVDHTVDDPNAGPKDIVCEVTEFGAMVEPVKVGSFAISGISLILHRSVLKDGNISGSLSLELVRAIPELNFTYMTKLFGPNWKVAKNLKLPHMKPTPPRQEHGNAEIEYLAGNTDEEFTFNPDAILGTAMFVLNGKK